MRIKKSKQKQEPFSFLRIHTPSYFPQFTVRLFEICPACSGVHFVDYDERFFQQSCTHHQHEYIKFKIAHLQRADTEYRHIIENIRASEGLSRLHKDNGIISIKEGSPWSSHKADASVGVYQ